MNGINLLPQKLYLSIAFVLLLTMCACGKTSPAASSMSSADLSSVNQSSISQTPAAEGNAEIPNKNITESSDEHFSDVAANSTADSAPDQTTETTLDSATDSTEKPDSTSQSIQETVYILNTKTMKIHNTWCNSVEKINPENYKETTESIEELEKQGYVKCKQKGDWYH